MGEVDFVICEVLIVETDGSPHFERKQIKKDRRRDNASAAQGYGSLRYYWEDIIHRPEETLAEIRAVLGAMRPGAQPRGG